MDGHLAQTLIVEQIEMGPREVDVPWRSSLVAKRQLRSEAFFIYPSANPRATSFLKHTSPAEPSTFSTAIST